MSLRINQDVVQGRTLALILIVLIHPLISQQPTTTNHQQHLLLSNIVMHLALNFLAQREGEHLVKEDASKLPIQATYRIFQK